MHKKRIRSRFLSIVLAGSVALALLPATPARAESSTLDPNLTIGLLVVVVGVLGWVAWTIDKEDKADRIQARSALLPLYQSDDDSAAIGLLLDQSSAESDELAFAAGLAIGRRF